MIRPVFVANWKMHKTVGESLEYVTRLKPLVAGLTDRQVVVAPPFTALSAVAAELQGTAIGLAAQNLSEHSDGAYTGEVSARMLADVGCTHVIVGHSERRALFGEDDERVGAKVLRALESGLRAIVCIGETMPQREAGRTFDVIEGQFKEALNAPGIHDKKDILIAYEPVWAIGTGRTATPGQAAEAHAFIRRLLGKLFGAGPARRIPIIYGGSVRPHNIGQLMAQADINGVLVGGASLDADSFGKIVSC